MENVYNITKNQTLIFVKGDSVFLQSYDSIVARYDIGGKYVSLGCDWDYSNTTLKYVKRFIASALAAKNWDDINMFVINDKALTCSSKFTKKDIKESLEGLTLLGIPIHRGDTQRYYNKILEIAHYEGQFLKDNLTDEL
jgi:hypothetical protein